MEHIPRAPLASDSDSELVDYLYQASCVHEHTARGLEWVLSMGVAMICQLEDAICDTHGHHQTIQRILKRVFRRYRLIHYAYELLRCLEVEIRRFSC